MEVDIAEQALSLMGALVLGLGLGLVYDLFRAMRVRFPAPLLGGFLDVLFWAVATVSLFVWSVVSGGGVVRVYIALGMLAGCWVYFQTLSSPILSIIYHIMDICSRLAHILSAPARFFLRQTKKFLLFFKNHFHYWQLWYKIGMIFREDDTPAAPIQRLSRGGKKHENN
jgi:spore cortex biosynthesis protein YabQ